MTETTLAVFASESHEPGAVGHITPHCEAKVTPIITAGLKKTVNAQALQSLFHSQKPCVGFYFCSKDF